MFIIELTRNQDLHIKSTVKLSFNFPVLFPWPLVLPQPRCWTHNNNNNEPPPSIRLFSAISFQSIAAKLNKKIPTHSRDCSVNSRAALARNNNPLDGRIPQYPVSTWGIKYQ